MNSDERQPLEEKADQAKQRLLDDVDRLEERKEAVVNSMRQAKASARSIAMGAAAATALLGTAWFVVHRRRKARSPKARWALPARQQPRSLASRLARELFFSGGTIVATHLLRWGLNRYVPIDAGTAEVRWSESS